MKKLGFGLMRLPMTTENGEQIIDINTVCRMVDKFIEEGFTYFDTAWMYCGYKSENAVRTALAERYPRNSYTIATKLHAGYLNDKPDCDGIFNEQLEKTGAGYFDYYLLHDLSRDNFEKCTRLDCFSWLSEKVKSGLVRHMGFSFHDSPELLERILTVHPEFEFVQLQINYLDWDSKGIRARECYETARRHGKPVIVMEPVKGGTLAALPKKAEELLLSCAPDKSVASWALRFAAGLEGVMTVLSGMSDEEQLTDNISTVENLKPLCDEEKEVLRRVVSIINSDTEIPCTGCEYCTDGCPMNIPIPKIFSLYNADRQEVKTKGWTPQTEYYDNLAKTAGAAGDCIGCGHCESMCPQHIEIIKGLKAVKDYFGK